MNKHDVVEGEGEMGLLLEGANVEDNADDRGRTRDRRASSSASVAATTVVATPEWDEVSVSQCSTSDEEAALPPSSIGLSGGAIPPAFGSDAPAAASENEAVAGPSPGECGGDHQERKAVPLVVVEGADDDDASGEEAVVVPTLA